MDVSRAYTGATTSALPHATICYDPFDIMQWVNAPWRTSTPNQSPDRDEHR
jgi:transposase